MTLLKTESSLNISTSFKKFKQVLPFIFDCEGNLLVTFKKVTKTFFALKGTSYNPQRKSGGVLPPWSNSS